MNNEWKHKIRSRKVTESIGKIELPQGEPFVVLRTKKGELAGRELESYEALYLLAEAISRKVWPDGSYKYVLPSVQSYFQIFCSNSKEGEQLRKAMASKKGWTPKFACREMILVNYSESVAPLRHRELKIPLGKFTDAESLAQIGSSMVMKIPDRSEQEPQLGRIVLYPRVTKKPNGSDIESYNDLWFLKHDVVKTFVDFSDALGTLVSARLLPKSSSVLIESGPVDRTPDKETKSYHLQVFISSENGHRTSWKDYSPRTFCIDTVFNCYPNVAECVALERIPRR